VIAVVQCKVCPVCHGTKIVDPAHCLPAARKEFVCENCRGEGMVPLLTCRGCGRPAMKWDDKVPHCGRKDCWDRLVEMVDLAKVRSRAIVPFGPGRRLREPLREAIGRVNGFVRNWQGRFWNPFRNEYQDEPFDAFNDRLTAQEEAAFHNACRAE
jgi:hypothetical protein